MTAKECPGRDQRTRSDSHNTNTPRVRSEAAAMAAAGQERTQIVEKALADTLATIVEKVPLSDEARERITGLMVGGGDES